MPTIKTKFLDFPDDDASTLALADMLKGIRENQVRAEDRASKNLAAMFLLAVCCELLNRTAVVELSFLGMKLGDLALVRKLLPLSVAYMFHTAICFFALRRLLWECNLLTVKRLYPALARTGLWRFINPPSNFETEAIIEELASNWIGKISSALSVPIMLAIAFGPAMFLVYTYVIAFFSFGLTDAILWISAILSTLLVAKGLLFFVGVAHIAPPAA